MLLESIQIRKIQKKHQKELVYNPTPNKKIDFLFKIRNSFTHFGEPYASPAGGIFSDDGTGVVIDGVLKYGFDIIHHEDKNEFYYEYSVRRWPQILIDIINETIKKF